MDKRFEHLTDLEVIALLKETKKTNFPEDQAFIKDIQKELAIRAKSKK